MTDNTLTITETYHPNGKIKSRICKNAQGQPHNSHGPAEQFWHRNGQLAYQLFYINDVLHNPNGPAVEHWNKNGQPSWQSFWINGERHNPHGPAVECWGKNGQPDYQRFWLNGKYLTEAEWKAKTQPKPVPVVLIDDVRYVPES